MGTFEKIAMFVMLLICITLFVGGVMGIIVMAAEVYQEEARRLRRWLRQRWRDFLAVRKEIGA